MLINDKEIIQVKYSTNVNWQRELPRKNWLCLLVDNNRERRYLDEVISKIINNDVCFICTVGQSCELTHDLVDEEITFREVDIENHYLPNHSIMTTWHEDFDEGIWFAINAAHHSEIAIKKVVILDLTDGNEDARISQLLDELTLKS